MKNQILIFFVAFILSSCASDVLLEEDSNSGTINFDVSVPVYTDMRTRGLGDTRAYSDGSTVSELKCYIYNRVLGEDAAPIRTENIEIHDYDDHRGGSLSIDLPTGQAYDFVFLATACKQDDNSSKVFYNPSGRTLNFNYDRIKTSDEDVDCFFGVLKGLTSEDKAEHSIVLKRPGAQLNIGTKDLKSYNELSSSPLETVGLAVDGVYSAMNVMDGSVIGDARKVAIARNALPSGQVFPVSGADYLSMSYLLVNERTNVGVTMTASNGDSSFNTEFSDVPLQRNHQTNIYGNLLTKTNDFKIEINPEFDGTNKKDLDDPYADYDLVVQFTDNYSSGSMNSCILEYTKFNGSYDQGYKIDLSKYLDNDKMVKVTWEELGIAPPIASLSFSQNNPSWSALKSVLKCDIGYLCLTKLWSMFNGCNNLVSVEAIKQWDTSEVTTMRNLFSGCSRLSSLDLSHFNTGNVTDLSYMFSGCSTLKSLDVASFDTSNVTDMTSMFSGCKALPYLDVTNFDTSNVTNMSAMFSGCKALPYLDVTNFDTSNVTNMSAMFSGCKALPYLDVTNFDTSNVTNMSEMFSGCQTLPSIDVTNFDTSNVASMISMFSDCQALLSLDVTNFDTSNVTSMTSMFSGCKALPYLDVTNFDTSKVMSMHTMFRDCQALSSLDVTNFDTSNVTSMTSMFSGCKALPYLDVTNFDTSNVTNMSEMFSGCQTLPSIDVTNFDTSNVTNMSEMFRECSSLADLDVKGFDTGSVTDMRMIFYGCKNLSVIDVSNFDTGNVRYLDYMFCDCSNVESLEVSGFDTKNVTSMNAFFKGCSKISVIDISNYNLLKCDRAYNMFADCVNLDTIYMCNIDFANMKGDDAFKINDEWWLDNTPKLRSIIGPVYNICCPELKIHSPLSNESAMVFINGLKQQSSNSVIYFVYATFASLNSNQIAIANEKGWTVRSL